MDFNGWLSVHFEKGSDATENMQRNDIRVLESKEKAHKRLWKWKDDNGVMHPEEIQEVFRMDKKKLSITEYRGDDNKAGSCKQRKGHLRMEELTKVINSSAHSRVFAIQ